jgi:hypothetical protein
LVLLWITLPIGVFSLEGGGYTDPSVNGVMQKKHNLFGVFFDVTTDFESVFKDLLSH